MICGVFALTMAARLAWAEEAARTVVPIEGSVDRGSFLPQTMAARSDGARATVFLQGGYEGAQRDAVFTAVTEAMVFDRVTLRAGATSFDGQTRPELGLRIDALRRERHGVDLAMFGAYEARGFNTVSALTTRVAISRAWSATRVTANVGYGFGRADGERYGDLRLAVLQRVLRHVHLGLDSRARADLERDADEPAGEPDWEIVAGPLLAVSIDSFVLTATGGYSRLVYRLVPGAHVGALASLGVGTVF